MIRRLRVKFVCINMAIVTIMLCVMLGTVLYVTRVNLEKESLAMMQSVVMEPMRLDAPGQREEGILLPYFSIQLGGNGEALAFDGGYYDLSDERLLNELLLLSSGQKTGVLREYDLRFARIATHGAQWVVFADMSSEISTMNHLLQNCLFIGAGSFLVFLVLSIFLARWAVKPVELAWEQQRQFVADASHELKTPLTVLLSSAQMLAGNGDDPRLREKLTTNLLRVTEQMKELVEQLLMAARTDQGAETMHFSRVDWGETVESALLPFDCVFYEGGKTLESDIQTGLFVWGSPRHLCHVVDILLDNAQKYGARQGRTQVTLRREGRRSCLLTVRSEGVPLSTQEQKEVFKRFYRVDTARERTGSYGLGLSIAENIVLAHKGTIWAESNEDGNTFCVRLPLEKHP